MDATEAATPYVEEAGFRFGKVTVRDRAGVLRKLKAEARAAMVENFKAAGVDDAGTKFAELENFDRTPMGTGDFIAHLNTPLGQEEILLIGLKKQYPGEGEAEKIYDGLTLSPGQTMNLVARMAGLEMQTKDEPKAAAGDEENPTPPGEPQPTPLRGYGAD